MKICKINSKILLPVFDIKKCISIINKSLSHSLKIKNVLKQTKQNESLFRVMLNFQEKKNSHLLFCHYENI